MPVYQQLPKFVIRHHIITSGVIFDRLLAVSRIDNKTMICDDCGTMEALDSVPHGILTPQECIWIAAAAGNKRAMENFNAAYN